MHAFALFASFAVRFLARVQACPEKDSQFPAQMEGGSGWESNPPRPATRPATGFEDQEAHRDLTTPARKDTRRTPDSQGTRCSCHCERAKRAWQSSRPVITNKRNEREECPTSNRWAICCRGDRWLSSPAHSCAGRTLAPDASAGVETTCKAGRITPPNLAHPLFWTLPRAWQAPPNMI